MHIKWNFQYREILGCLDNIKSTKSIVSLKETSLLLYISSHYYTIRKVSEIILLFQFIAILTKIHNNIEFKVAMSHINPLSEILPEWLLVQTLQ